MTTQKPLPGTAGADDDATAYDTGYGTGYEGDAGYDDPIDLTNIPDRLPEGVYNFVISKAEAGRSKKSDQPMVTLHCEVIDGEFAGQNLREYLSFSPNASTLESAERKLSAIMGHPMKLKSSTGELARMLAGRSFRARTKVEEYNGSNQPKLALILGPVGSTTDNGSTAPSRPRPMARRASREDIDL